MVVQMLWVCKDSTQLSQAAVSEFKASLNSMASSTTLFCVSEQMSVMEALRGTAFRADRFQFQKEN
jgi:hypothetical protein